MDSLEQQKLDLHEKIAMLEGTLVELKSKLNEIEEQEQHEAIDHLEKYLEELNHHYSHLQSVGQILVKELHKVFH
ncbi:hypothetical protein [Sessilibacter corallicola]|uniref:Uncharacterized protein n=1 Tax=Sessilibacter corallicola TaxID=2904075 RepID=A0ABQ0A680_9GAMM|nr:hypothetical protein [Sessilibacter corallicola]MCE2027927.1 hypothetical protein [Sessilibacter corallicola]